MENMVDKLFRFISEEVKLEGRILNPDDTEEEKIKKLREKGLKKYTREGKIPNPDDTEEEKIKKLIEQEKEEPKEPEPKKIEKEEPKKEEKPAEEPEEPVAGEEIILVLPEEAIAGLVTPEEGEAIAKEEQEELAKAGETHPPAALYSLAKEAGISKSKAERYWKETKEKYKEWMGKSDKDLTGRDYQYIMGVVKKRMKLPVKPVESKTVEPKSERYFVADLDKLELIKENGELKVFASKDEATKYIQENKLNAEVVSL